MVSLYSAKLQNPKPQTLQYPLEPEKELPTEHLKLTVD